MSIVQPSSRFVDSIVSTDLLLLLIEEEKYLSKQFKQLGYVSGRGGGGGGMNNHLLLLYRYMINRRGKFDNDDDNNDDDCPSIGQIGCDSCFLS